ncbi:MAG: SPOR domain-containing protein [Flavobacteriales bacterium]
MNLDQHIASLLEEHDCVIVPDFGGFVANYAPAKINKVNHRFDPPYRKISFNKLLTHNDGLLAAYVAQKENEQYAQALAKVKDYAVYLKSELKGKKRVEFDRIGVLFQLADGTFRFEQLKNADLFREGFGLESFFSKPIERKPMVKSAIEPKAEAQPKPEVKIVKPEPKVIPIEKAPEPEVQAEEKEPETTKRKIAYWPAAAALVGISVVGYALWLAIGTPLLKDRSQFHSSDLNPFSEKICPEYQVRSGSISVEPLESIEDEIVAIVDIDTIYDSPERDKTVVASIEEKADQAGSAELPFHVIGGCFGEMSNAERLVAKYLKRGSNAAIIDKKGTLNRVSVASYATKKEAEQALASFRDDIPNAWILYK